MIILSALISIAAVAFICSVIHSQAKHERWLGYTPTESRGWAVVLCMLAALLAALVLVIVVLVSNPTK